MMTRTYFRMTDASLTVEDLTNIITGTSHANELAHMLWDHYYDNWIVYNDVDGTKPTAKLTSWRRRMKNIYDLTKVRYEALLGIYETNISKLMNQLTNETKIKFNDTPQNGGDYDDADHVSNVSTTTSTADNEAVVDRIYRIQKTLVDLMQSWIGEFRGLYGGHMDE